MLNIVKRKILRQKGPYPFPRWGCFPYLRVFYRVAYYARFQNLADDRLCKVIFNMLRNTENSEYHAYFKNLFIDLGLDHYVYKVL